MRILALILICGTGAMAQIPIPGPVDGGGGGGGGGGGMVYPGAGVANSTGASWGTSYIVTQTGAASSLVETDTGGIVNGTGFIIPTAPATAGGYVGNSGISPWRLGTFPTIASGAGALFQPLVGSNSSVTIVAMPSGVNTTSAYRAANSSDPSNYESLNVFLNSATAQLDLGTTGTPVTPVTSMRIGERNITNPALTTICFEFNNVCQGSLSNAGVPTWLGLVSGFVQTNGSGVASVVATIPATALPTNIRARAIGITFDGGGSALSSGVTKYLRVPFACTLSDWSILVDTGTATIKTWKIATGTAIPTVANSISTSGVSISSGTATPAGQSMGDFTTLAVAKSDIFAFNLFAVASATQVNFILECDQ